MSFRLANMKGRAAVVLGGCLVDVERVHVLLHMHLHVTRCVP